MKKTLATCTTCHGTRHIIRLERERWGGGGTTWYYTGKLVKRLYQCPTCKGIGSIDPRSAQAA